MEEARKAHDRNTWRIGDLIAELHHESRRPLSKMRIRQMRAKANALADLFDSMLGTSSEEVQIEDVAGEQVSPPLKEREDLNDRVDALNAAEALLDGRMSVKDYLDG